MTQPDFESTGFGNELSIGPQLKFPIIHLQAPRTSVLDAVEFFPESFHRSAKDLITQETQRIMAHPGRKYIDLAVGRPRIGGSQLSMERAMAMTWPGSELADFAERTGRQIRVATLEWGQACLPFADSFTNEAEELFFNTITKWLGDRQSDTIDLLYARHTSNAGAVVEKGRKKVIVGEPRAPRQLKALATHSEAFEEFDYDDLWNGSDASPEVTNYTTQERVALQALKTEEEREAYLQSHGKQIHRVKEGKIFPLAAGSATVGNIADIDRAVDQTIEGLLKLGELDLPVDLKWKVIGVRDIQKNPWLRAKVIGRALNRSVFRLLGVPIERQNHIYNQRVITESVDIYQDLDTKFNLLIAYYPDLFAPFLEDSSAQ